MSKSLMHLEAEQWAAKMEADLERQERRAIARFRCSFCGAHRGSPCKSRSSLIPRPPHAARMQKERDGRP